MAGNERQCAWRAKVFQYASVNPPGISDATSRRSHNHVAATLQFPAAVPAAETGLTAQQDNGRLSASADEDIELGAANAYGPCRRVDLVC